MAVTDIRKGTAAAVEGLLALGASGSPNRYCVKRMTLEEVCQLADVQGVWKSVQEIYSEPCRTASEWQSKFDAAVSIISKTRALNLSEALLGSALIPV